MIHILHYGLKTNRGGIETYLDKIWTHIDKSEFHFDFIDEWGGKVFFREKFEKMGSLFYEITPRRKSIIKNRNDISRVLNEHRPDILHCHLNTLSYITPVVIAVKLGIPVIVHSRSAGSNNRLITKVLHKINKIRLSQKRITRIAVSSEAGIWLFGKKSQFMTINNGIDIESYVFSEEKRQRLRAEWGLSPDTFVIGTVGSLSYPKNHSFLIDVFRQIEKDKTNSRLVIVGSGALKNKLQDKIESYGLSSKILLLENRDDISCVLSAFDVFVMPSIYEGFPNAALEAQTSGLPCFLSDSITREVDVSNVKYLSLKESIETWSKEISNCKPNCHRIDGRRIVNEAGFSVEREIDVISKVYRSLFSNGEIRG